MPTVNTAIQTSLYLTDSAGDPLTGADLGDFTATATRLGSTTTAQATISERSGGLYALSFTPTAAGFWELFVTYDDGTTARQFADTWEVTAANDAETITDAVAARLRRAVVTVTAPVSTTQTVTLMQGDDYLAADGRALEWTSTGWPDLTGAAVTWQVGLRGSETLYPVTVVDAATVRVELTTAQTNALTPRVVRTYQLVATLTNGSVVTLTHGELFVAPA
jgi:hypothetical protein